MDGTQPTHFLDLTLPSFAPASDLHRKHVEFFYKLTPEIGQNLKNNFNEFFYLQATYFVIDRWAQ